MFEPMPIDARRFARRMLRTVFGVAFAVTLFYPWRLALAEGSVRTPQFDSNLPESSEEGHLTLRWKDLELQPGDAYQLEQADNPEFEDARLVLDGRDHISFVSGLTDGTYYFRVRVKPADGVPGAWSAPHSMAVEHHSLSFSLALFALGAAVFALTVAFISSEGFRKGREAGA